MTKEKSSKSTVVNTIPNIRRNSQQSIPRNRLIRLPYFLLAIFIPLTAVIWLFQLNPDASSAPEISRRVQKL